MTDESINHIVNECNLRLFDGGFQTLHCKTTEAIFLTGKCRHKCGVNVTVNH